MSALKGNNLGEMLPPSLPVEPETSDRNGDVIKAFFEHAGIGPAPEAIVPPISIAASSDDEIHSVPRGFAAQVIETVRARGNAYGSPAENHQTTADLLSSWFSRRFKQDIKLTPEDVIVVNVIQKISRLANVSKDDSWLDIAGYTENVAMIRPDQRNGATLAKRNDLVGKTYSASDRTPFTTEEIAADPRCGRP